jgi:putative transposase
MIERYVGYRYPKSVIGYAVFLYHRFRLSLRDVSELLAERGVVVTYETIRLWCKNLAHQFAKRLKKKLPSPGDKVHIDEVRVVINGEVYWLWRAVDRDGDEIDILLQKRRNAKAAMRFFKRLLLKLGKAPRVLVTDKLRSYRKAKRILLPNTEHRSHKRLNNRIENSHQPTREKERQMRKFKSPGSAQRFLSSMGKILNLFKVGRYKHQASVYRQKLQQAFTVWNDLVTSHHPYA